MPITKIIIVEDEPLIAADLSNLLQRAGFEILKEFPSGEEVIAHLETESHPDLILMDIQLEGDLDGVDTAHQINLKYDIPIIFLTSNTDSETFNRAKMSYPHSFLSKPFRINDVIHAIELAIESVQQGHNNSIEYLTDRVFIKSNSALEKVLFKNILYFEANGSYTKIKTLQKEYLLSQTLKKTEDKLIKNTFLKVHRSYIINVENVDRITDGYVFLSGNKIPVSRQHKEDLLKLFKTI